MNILVVCDVLGNETNGTTIAAMNLIRYLQKNHNVKILCADESKKGLENYYVVPNLSLGNFLDKIVQKNNVTLAKPQNDIIEQALVGVEHVHIMLPFILGRRVLKLIENSSISITAGFHAQAENVSAHVRLHGVGFVNKAIYKNFYCHFYKFVDGIHYPTQFIRDCFEQSIKVSTKGFVISNGVNSHIKKMDAEKPDAMKDKIVILSTGRYSVEKAQEVLIKSVMHSKYKDKIQLVLAGQGPLENKFKKLGKKLPIEPIMKVFSREDMCSILNSSDLYVHPAKIELEGIACLEAICAGKLVIVSDSKKSATKNFAVDEKCVFKSGNYKDLASKIDYFIEHPLVKAEFEQKYLESSSQFDQEECMKKMEQMIITTHAEKLAQQHKN